MEITEEELRKMKPEQILQLQKQNCVFCQIISGKIPAKKVYENETAIALLDINPAAPGHVILLPKEHYQIMALMPDETVGNFFAASKLISRAMLKALKAEGTTIFAANGTIAGQRAPHFMLHIIPRFEADGLNINVPSLDADQATALVLLRSKVKEVMGVAVVEAEFEDVKEKAEELSSSKEGPMEEKKPEAKKQTMKKEKKEQKKEGGKINLDDLAGFLGGK